MKTKQIDGSVYFVASDNGLIKIGVSTDMRKRMTQLTNESANKIWLAGAINFRAEDQGALYSKERELHRMFAAHRKHGEWFEYTNSIKTYIMGNCNANCDHLNEMINHIYTTYGEFRAECSEKMVSGTSRAAQKRKESYIKSIKSLLVNYPGATIPTIIKNTGCSDATCRRYLNELESSGAVSHDISQIGKYQRDYKWYLMEGPEMIRNVYEHEEMGIDPEMEVKS